MLRSRAARVLKEQFVTWQRSELLLTHGRANADAATDASIQSHKTSETNYAFESDRHKPGLIERKQTTRKNPLECQGQA